MIPEVIRNGAKGSALFIRNPLTEEIPTQTIKLRNEATTKVKTICIGPNNTPSTKPNCTSPKPIPCLLVMRNVTSIIKPRLPTPTNAPKIDSFNGKIPNTNPEISTMKAMKIRINGMFIVKPSIQAMTIKMEKSKINRPASNRV